MNDNNWNESPAWATGLAKLISPNRYNSQCLFWVGPNGFQCEPSTANGRDCPVREFGFPFARLIDFEIIETRTNQ